MGTRNEARRLLISSQHTARCILFMRLYASFRLDIGVASFCGTPIAQNELLDLGEELREELRGQDTLVGGSEMRRSRSHQG